MRALSTGLFAVAVATAALLTTAQAASAEGWRIVDKVGQVEAGAPGVHKASVSRDDVLGADAWIVTGSDGRAVLARGKETIVVAPQSRLQLPDEEVNGNTQVLQTLGSAFYQIGKQQKPHFQVNAPALAAVVKGTAFTVTVEDGQSSVAVSEGLVEVATLDRTSIEFVRPGFTATAVNGANSLVLERGAATAPEAPKPEDKAAPEAKEEPKADKSAETITIPATVGAIDLDIKSVSEGLAFGEETSVAAVDATDKAEKDGKAKGHDKDKALDKPNGGPVSTTVALVTPDAGAGPAVGGGSAPDLGAGGAAAPVVDAGASLAPDLGDDIDTGPPAGAGGGAGKDHDKPEKVKVEKPPKTK